MMINSFCLEKGNRIRIFTGIKHLWVASKIGCLRIAGGVVVQHCPGWEWEGCSKTASKRNFRRDVAAVLAEKLFLGAGVK